MKIWDIDTGREISSTAGFVESTSLALSSDDRQIAVACQDAAGGFQIKVFSADGEETATLGSIASRIFDISFIPGSSRLLASSDDSPLRIWDSLTMEEVVNITHRGDLPSVAISPDGQQIAGASDYRNVMVWDVASGTLIRTISGHLDDVLSVAFHPDGQHIVSGSQDGTIRIWNATTGQELVRYDFGSAVVGVAISADGRHVAAVGRSSNETAKVWSTEMPLQGVVRSWSVMDSVSAVAISPDGRYLASGHPVSIWDLESGLHQFTLERDSVTCLEFSPDSRLLASGSRHRTVRNWNSSNGKLVRTLEGFTSDVVDVAFSPDGQRLAAAGYKAWGRTERRDDHGEVKVWDVDTGRELFSMQQSVSPYYGVAFSPDGRWIATANGWDCTARLWDRSGREVHVIKWPSHAVGCVAFRPDSQILAVSTRGESEDSGAFIKLVAVETGAELLTFRAHTNSIRALTYSPDGRRIASAGETSIKLFDSASGLELLTLRGHQEKVNDVAFSPNGRWLASCSHDQTVKLWEGEDATVASGKTQLLTDGGHLARVPVKPYPDPGDVPGLPDGLVSYWDFDEGGEPTLFGAVNYAYDRQGGNDATFTGSATRAPGIAGKGAARFDNADHCGVNVGSKLSSRTGVSIEALVVSNCTETLHNEEVIFCQDADDSRHHVMVSFRHESLNHEANRPVAAGPVLSFGLHVNGDYSELEMPLDGLEGRPTLEEMTNRLPHYIVATYDNATGEKPIYIDGMKRFGVNLGPGSGVQLDQIYDAYIGNSRIPVYAFTGVIDEVAFWDRALTDQEIAEHYANFKAGRNYFQPAPR
jgi:WD40 repeat protein